ncbi:MAG TPA: cytosol nonspecific dipeptidase, partial [Prevotellaceae bacterium]|nr:cytosol nonspecific dipeptidase [Prevotellaceae bacterium]
MSEFELKPASVFECFAQINRVPRPSKKEEQMIKFLLDFGHNLGLESVRDETGNVLIRKPATPGMENRKTLILQ